MILPITEKYRLIADRYTWMIQEPRGIDRKTGGIRWESIAWYPNLSQTVDGLYDLVLRTSDAKTVAEALQVAKQTTATLVQALSPTFEIRETRNPAVQPGPKNAQRTETCPSIAK